MAFIRKRLSSRGRDGERYSYQLIETYRDGGKVKQRVLINLGRSATLEQAEKDATKSLEFWAREVAGMGKFPWLGTEEDHKKYRRYASWRAECEKAFIENLAAIAARVTLRTPQLPQNLAEVDTADAQDNM